MQLRNETENNKPTTTTNGNACFRLLNMEHEWQNILLFQIRKIMGSEILMKISLDSSSIKSSDLNVLESGKTSRKYNVDTGSFSTMTNLLSAAKSTELWQVAFQAYKYMDTHYASLLIWISNVLMIEWLKFT